MSRRTITWLAVVTCSLAAVRMAAAGEAGSPPAAGTTVREGPAVLPVAGSGVGEMVPADAAFTDLAGKPGRLADYRGRKATVLCITSATCPLAKKYGPTLAALEAANRARGVAFVLINPSTAETRDQTVRASADLKRLGLEARYVHGDAARSLATVLRATTSTQVFVLDAALSLAYRGAIDDQFGLGYALPQPNRRFLADALDAVLAGRAADVPATSAPGCLLELPPAAPKAPPTPAKPPETYHNRISRIVQRHCQQCHRAGEAAPFELMSYADVKGRTRMIRKVVGDATMPPWFADPKVGHWSNDPSLAPRDRDALIAWIAAGAPEGDPADAPLPATYAEGWRIGKPDAVFQPKKPVKVPAKGPIPYQYVTIDTKLNEDRWISAVEIRVSQPQVVHHLLAFVIYPPGHPKAKGQPDPRGGLNGYFAALVPNQGATRYPAGTAKLLPRGATLLLQIHYTPDGTAVEDLPKVGVTWAKGPPEHEVLTLAAFNNKFRIPPGAANHEVTGVFTFPEPGRLLSVMPHAHLRAKGFRYELTLPAGGGTRTVLEVPRYDFNWQLEYVFREPLDVPAGAKLKVTGWYDNSAANPANPDATKWVKFGEQTSDEMMIGYFTGHRLPGPKAPPEQFDPPPAPTN